jgi:hypothetical protein
MKHYPLFFLLLTFIFSWISPPAVIAQAETQQHLVQPGDTWTALAWQYGLDETTIRQQQMNPQREPIIGTIISLPQTGQVRRGILQRPFAGLLETSVRYNLSPWSLAIRSDIHPYLPNLYQPIFIEDQETLPRDLPIGMSILALSQIPAHPGQAVALRGISVEGTAVNASLNNTPMDTLQDGRHLIALAATGAFFGKGAPELTIQTSSHAPLWTQPWLFVDPNEWDYQQITLTGTAAEIDQESIRQERERLFALWSIANPAVQWAGSFQLPVQTYLEISSAYGARRSYNGGPYSSYHEGVDFAAYGGTAVTAPASGTVILAENLYVRGGAVIIDHGLGVYSGFYHMSAIHVGVGTAVQPGDLIGEVGTTGLSTGNHLHWDLLVADTWIDAWAWWEQDMGCWLLAGLERPCS